MLDVPAITFRCFKTAVPPLGLQLFGFADRAAAPFSIARGVLAVLK
jgi:hypothetical protein